MLSLNLPKSVNDHWSASQLTTLLGCEGRFKAHYIDEQPQGPPSKHMYMGILLDHVLSQAVDMTTTGDHFLPQFMGWDEWINQMATEKWDQCVAQAEQEGSDLSMWGDRDELLARLIQTAKLYWIDGDWQSAKWVGSQIPVDSYSPCHWCCGKGYRST